MQVIKAMTASTTATLTTTTVEPDLQQQTDRQIIDTIIYLATLASERSVLDPLLNVLRIVTAKLTPDTPMSEEDRKKLFEVQAQLEDYLVNRDPLRKLSREDLDEQIRARLVSESAGKQRSLRRSLGLSWAIAAAAALLVLALPLPLPLMIHLSILPVVFIIGLHAGSAWFYATSLRFFNEQLRRAYALIVAGMIIIGLNALQFPFVTVLDATNLPIFRYGGALPIFTVSCFLFYLAMRMVGQLLGVKSRLMSLRFVGATSALLAIVTVFLPHWSRSAQENLFDFSMVCDLLVALHTLYAGILAHKISKQTTEAYAGAIGFFSKTMFVTALNVTWYGACLFTFGELQGLSFALASLPHMATEIMLLQSGYIFKKKVAV